MIKLILDHFSNASDAQLHHGMRWYYSAHHMCKRISKHTKTDLFKVVGVLSALSPRNRWERNITDAVDVIRKGKKAKVATFGAMKRKALRVLEAESESEVLEILNGEKIKSFYMNIMHPYKSADVTVDVWAMRSVNYEGNLNKGAYRSIKQAYIDASKLVGVKPHELQAIVWGVVRDGN